MTEIDANKSSLMGQGLSANDLFNQAFNKEQPSTNESIPDLSAGQEETEENLNSPELSPMEVFEQYSESEDNVDETSENISADAENVNEGLDLLSKTPEALDSNNLDIEEVFVKGAEGRRQKLEVNYTDRKAIKQAFIKAAGMRKFQAERDAALKSTKSTKEEFDSLKNDFSKIEKAYEEHGAQGIIELLGGEAAWTEAVDKELSHRDYVSNLSADEKYQMELQKRDEQYQRQIASERSQREQFQKQIEVREEQAAVQQLESKLHPAFDRYRFAGKLGDTATENLYDEAIWSKVKERLAEFPDTLELNQAAIDKEFRTVSNMFRKHISSQTEKKLKTAVENKKVETAQRAQVAAKKGLSGSAQQRQMMQSLKSGNLMDALSMWTQNK